MNNAIEQLNAEKVKTEQALAQAKHQQQRLKNRIRYYEDGDRKQRAHRLITRGAAVESVAPEIKSMSEQDFYALAEQIFALPEVRALLPNEDGGD